MGAARRLTLAGSADSCWAYLKPPQRSLLAYFLFVAQKKHRRRLEPSASAKPRVQTTDDLSAALDIKLEMAPGVISTRAKPRVVAPAGFRGGPRAQGGPPVTARAFDRQPF